MDEFKKGREILLNNGIIAFPTDTVIGLGVNGTDPVAVKKLFALKKRAFDKPLSLLTFSLTEITKYASAIPSCAYELFEKYFPGALTVVLNSSEELYTTPLKKGKSIGVRIPNSYILLNFLAYIKIPLLATSANITNHPPLLNKNNVLNTFGEAVYPLLFQHNVESSNVPSTVVDCREGKPIILRKGALTLSLTYDA